MKIHKSIKSIGRLIIVGIFLLYGKNSMAQEAPLLDWAKNTGATLYNGGNGIATDASGNVYTTGNFFGTQDFDPGPGVFNMSVTGSDDGIFISKLNSNGDFVWAKSIKNVYNTADAIAVDASGNIVIAGFFDKGDVMDFDPGPGTFNLSAVGYDMFVLKLTTDGDFVWAKHIKGSNTAAHAFPESIALDPAGNIYTTGYFQTTIDFDPSAGTFNLTAGEFRDIFISKLDADGNFVWAKAMLGAGTCGACDDKARSIALDASGNVYTNGFLRGTADFDPGPGIFNLTPASGGGFFISKLDNNGNFIWAKTFGGTASGVADVGDMALDASANIYITGGVYGTSDFDPGAGTFNLTSAGSSDIFISKLDVNGDFVWARLFGAGSFDYATTLDTDGAGNIYTAGNFSGTIDFDPSSGTFNLAGGSDYFLQKLDTDGNFVWAYSMNSGFDMSIKVQSPNLYITGQLQAATIADLDPGPCSLNSNPGAVFTKKLRLGTPLLAPTISSFTPTIGPIGTTVTITGTNFSTTPADNVVKFFNNRTATVTASTATSITAVVPASTVTGVISVTTNCLTATSATNFTVGVASIPTITSFTPVSGPVGTTVTITGTNFSTTPANNTVAFNGTTAVVTASTATSITTTVPAGTTTGTITVTVAGNTATSTNNFTVTVLQPEINIKQNATNIASAGLYAFGNQAISTSSAAVTFTIENTGTSVLNLSGNPKVAIAGANASEFTVNQTATTAMVAAAGTTTFTITFSPGTAASKTAQLSIANSDGNENPYLINLTGTGASCTNPAKPTITHASSGDFISSTLTASAAPAGGTYQWFNNGTAIDNATLQSYTTSVMGAYTVRITVAGGCSATSDPFAIVVTAIEPPTTNDFALYPNPVKGDWLTLSLGQWNGKKDIAIYQTTGKQLLTHETLGNEANLYVGEYPAGMYIVRVSTSNSVGVLKFIKQ
jgi:hypothetical protein